MNEEHLEFLIGIEYQEQGQVGRNVFNFGNQVQQIENIPNWANHQFDRNDLDLLYHEPNTSNLFASVAIFAWGGMNINNARILFNKWRYLEPIVSDLRHGVIGNRQQAFDIFRNEREQEHLPGLGIAFFTKLICFLNPGLNGYILDQWTAKSINLLWYPPLLVNLINFNGNGWVNDNNGPEIYETYCQRVEELSNFLQLTPRQTEELLFDHGGIHPGQWRNYVIQHYPPGI